MIERIFFVWAIYLAGIAVGGSALADTAQAKLPTTVLSMAGKSLTVEVAADDESRARGLMFRTTLGEDEGMLFLMDEPTVASFYMRNTLIPLSIAFLNESGVILEIHDMEPLDETPVLSTFGSIAYALEVNQGWFEKNGVIAGDEIRGLPRLE